MDATSEELTRHLQRLANGKSRWTARSASERLALARACADGVVQVAREWVDAACAAKGLPAGSPQRAEEILAGPLATLRFLRLLAHSLEGIARNGVPRLPGKPVRGADGRLRVPLMPTGCLYDSVVFFPYRVAAWMKPGITPDDLPQCLATAYRRSADHPPRLVAVLGAGNVSAIPATDSLSIIFHEGHVAWLKMNPVNEYLGPLFERAFRPLIDADCLHIAYGGADVGAQALGHPLVEAVHITGSLESHDRIVWGPAGPEREERKRAGRPLITKPITSELGNVSPWIFVPGRYSPRQLQFQAENVAASITNNASFNCLATKVIVTSRQWAQRDEFLARLRETLERTPRRVAYYPGAIDRFRRFAPDAPPPLDNRLPWTLLTDLAVDASPRHFREESFVAVCAETTLDEAEPTRFLPRAVDFVNERLAGTLSAAVTVPNSFRSTPAGRRTLDDAIGRLRYGAVSINHWPGLTYGLMSPPWGAFPGHTLDDAQSGIGWVHNSFLLDGIEKSVLEGPLTVLPKPPWLVSHTRPESVAWALFDLYSRPTWSGLVGVLRASWRG